MSKMDQADAGAPALSEKVNVPIEMLKDAFSCLLDHYVRTYRNLDLLALCGLQMVPDFESRAERFNPVSALNLLNLLTANEQARVNFSNEPERDPASLDQSLHHTQSKEG